MTVEQILNNQTCDLSQIQALMLDIDGVLLASDGPIKGAREAVETLIELGLSIRFVTNTTKLSRNALIELMRGHGFPVASQQLFSVAALARQLMERKGAPSYRLLGAPELEADLGPGRLALTDRRTPGWVVLGLHPPSFTHDVLNIGFRDLIEGAQLVALHANRMWRTTQGLEIGLGAYVHALEYASQTRAIIMGKPSPSFFKEVLSDLDLPAEQVAMVGDDVESDIGGAQALNIPGFLVKTGKYTERSLELSGVTPTLILEDISALAAALKRR